MARLVCAQCGASYSLVEGMLRKKVCGDCNGVLKFVETPEAAPTPKKRESEIPPGGEQILEIALPARNASDVPAVRQFLSALSLPVSLEYYGDSQRRVLLLRGSETALQAAAAQLAACWPTAALRILEEDPTAHLQRDAQARIFDIQLAEKPSLPLRIWDTFTEGDPVLAVLATLAGLRDGEALWIQIGLHARVRPEWLGPAQRQAKIEGQRGRILAGNGLPGAPIPFHPTEERPRAMTILFGTVTFLMAMGITALGLFGLWLLVIPGLFAVLGVAVVWGRLERRAQAAEGVDVAMLRSKVVTQSGLVSVSLRVALRGDGAAREKALRERLEALLTQYTLAGGNRLVMKPAARWTDWKAAPERQRLELNVEELAGLWHLPWLGTGAPVPGLTPTSAVASRAPDPREVQGFFRIGTYHRADGSAGEVRISAQALRRNMALFGKPGTGKSTLMATLALAALAHPDHPAVVVVDAHGDLADALLGILPAEAAERVRLLDAGDTQYLLTLNPLDAHRAGASPEAAARLIEDVGRALWGENWGPRMRIPLNRAVQALAAANARRAPDAQYGLALLATLVNCSHAQRQAFLDQAVGDGPEVRVVRKYFAEDFRQLTPNMREQIIQPVLSKAYRFLELPLLPLLSCPQAVLDLGQILAERRLLIINTDLAANNAEASDFLGSLLLNLLLRQLVQQGQLPPAERAPLVVIVDEFQSYTGVPWAEWEQQVRKWGGSVVLGTQSLAALRASGEKELPGIITSGTGSLFTFAVNGEDAAYLARYELGQDAGGPSPETLTSLPPFQCYARLLGADGAPARPFTLWTDPPRPFQAALAGQVRAARSRYALAYAQALARAQEMLDALDAYAPSPSVTSHGSGSSNRPTAGPEAEIQDALLGNRDGSNPPEGEKGMDENEDLADAVARDLSQFFPQDAGEGDTGENPAKPDPPESNSADSGSDAEDPQR